MQPLLLWLEFALVFVAIPLLLWQRVIPLRPIPMLVVLALGAYGLLRADPHFDASRLWNAEGAWSRLLPMLVRSAVLCGLIAIGVWLYAPGVWFSFVRAMPGLWLVVMIGYPLLSVYPQEVIFRAFFLHRYEPLFGSGALMIGVSAAVFGLVHLPFGHWLSVVLTAIGGVLFGLSYMESKSLLLASIEHAIFGNFLFTIGLGEYFYHGAARARAH